MNGIQRCMKLWNTLKLALSSMLSPLLHQSLCGAISEWTTLSLLKTPFPPEHQ
jgi:hypothetical protein